MPHAEFDLETCHTIGNLLQTYALEDEDVSFFSCHGVHPLERKVTIKIATHEGAISTVLDRVVRRIDQELARVQEECLGQCHDSGSVTHS